MCSSVSGLAFVWNYGLVEGFRENLIVLSVAGLAATCVGLCLTELTSALPLSDGIYGLARSMLNPLAGYLVGFNEVLSQLVFVAHLAFLFGLCVTFMIDGDSRVMDGSDYMNGTSAALFQPMMWLLFVLIILVPALQYQHHLLWRAIIAYGVLCVLLLLVYILGSSASARVDRFPFWSGDERGLGPLFPSSAGGFFAILPYALWVFRGVDVLTLTCSITSKVHLTSTSIQYCCFCYDFCITILAVFLF